MEEDLTEPAVHSSRGFDIVALPPEDDSLTEYSSRYASSSFDSDGDSLGFGLGFLRRAQAEEDITKPYSRHPLTLRFKDRSLENKFVYGYYGSSLLYFRLVSPVIALLYTTFLLFEIQISLSNTIDSDRTELVVRALQAFVGTAWFVVVWTSVCCLWMCRRKKASSFISKTVELPRADSFSSQLDSPAASLPLPRSFSDSIAPVAISPTSKMTSATVSEPNPTSSTYYGAFFDYAIMLPTSSLMMVLHGFTSGYLARGTSSPLLTTTICLFIVFRMRTFPILFLSSLIGVATHIVSLLCTVALGTFADVRFDRVVVSTPTDAVFGCVELLVLCVAVLYLVASRYESMSRKLFVVSERSERLCDALLQENERERALLRNVFPEQIVDLLGSGSGSYVSRQETVAALVNDIAGFTRFCAVTDTQVVFRFLNLVYRQFDERAERFGITKVKTIGDSWFGISYHPSQTMDPIVDAVVCVRTALGMARDFKTIVQRFYPTPESEDSPQNLALRTGVALSSSWVYVLGATNKKTKNGATLTFDVIGDAATRASMLEGECAEGEVWVCEEIRNVIREAQAELDDEAVEFEFEEVTENGIQDVLGFSAFSVRLLLVGGRGGRRRRRLTLPLSIPRFEDSDLSSMSGNSTSSFEEIVDDHGMKQQKKKKKKRKRKKKKNRFVVLVQDWWTMILEMLFHQHFRHCDDCHAAQVIAIRIVFGIVGVVVLLETIAVWLAQYDTIVQGAISGIAGLIVLVSVSGMISARAMFVSVSLQWLSILLFQAWTIAIVVFPPTQNLDAITSVTYQLLHAVNAISPFVTMIFPSIPFIVKVFLPLGAPFLFVQTDMNWDVPLPPFRGFLLNFFTVYLSSLLGMCFHHLNLVRYHCGRDMLSSRMDSLKEETMQNERLLDSALPREITERLLHSDGLDNAFEYYEDGGCLFCHVSLPKDSSSSVDSESGIVRILEDVFGAFDSIVSSTEGIVKVKSTGSRYLCVVGIDNRSEISPHENLRVLANVSSRLMRAAIELRETSVVDPRTTFSFGCHLGGFCGGLCGKVRWVWDVFGDSINVTSRQASSAKGDEIRCSPEFGEAWNEIGDGDELKRKLELSSRGVVQLKGVGEVESFVLEART